MTNGTSLAGDMWKELPTWVKAVLQIGVLPAAFAWMLYLFSTEMAGDVRDLKVSVLQHVVTTDAMMQRLNERDASRDMKLDILIRIQQTQCVNASTDALQRRDCVNAGR